MSRMNPSHDVGSYNSMTFSKMAKKNDKITSRSSQRPVSRTIPVNMNTRPQSARSTITQIKNEPLVEKTVIPIIADPTNDQELVHKEYLDNKMAKVEVTVRTVSNRSRSNSEERPNINWNKYSPRYNNDCPTPRVNYDYALGTIHYLSKELQHKLQNTCPGDPSIEQIVKDIQHTLYRMNPDTVNPDYSREYGDSEYFKKIRRSSSAQTLEQVTRKLTELQACEEQVKMEHEVGKEKLNQEIKELTAKNEESTITIKQLEKEKEDLEHQLKENSASSTNNQELQTQIQKLKEDNQTIEMENMSMKHELTLMKLEREKMSFLLESRDKQMKALRKEMDSIQTLVCSQLSELKAASSTRLGSRCNIDSKISLKSSKSQKPIPANIQEIYNSKFKLNFPDIVSSVNLLSKKDTRTTIMHDEFPQRDVPLQKEGVYPVDSKIAPSEMTLVSEIPDIDSSNVKDMFEELKRQALDISQHGSSTETCVAAQGS